MAEVEVVVQEAEEGAERQPVQEKPCKMQLACIGAVAMAQDAVVACVGRFVERGEGLERQGKSFVRDRMNRRKHQVRKLVRRGEKDVEAAEVELEGEIEGLLDRMNVPTKSDIDALSAQVSALTAKVDELREA